MRRTFRTLWRWKMPPVMSPILLRAGAVIVIALMPAVTPAQKASEATPYKGAAGEPAGGKQSDAVHRRATKSPEKAGKAAVSPQSQFAIEEQTPPRIISGESSRPMDDPRQPSNALPVDAMDDVGSSGRPDIEAAPLGLPRRSTGVDVSTDPSAGTGVDASTDPLIDVRRRWQEAVRTGATDLGFRAFVLGALEPDTDGLAGPMRRPLDGANVDPPPGIFERPQAERTRDASVSWENRAGPVGLGKAGRVVTVFGASIPTAFCAPLVVCTIELEPGEELTDTPSWGDTVRWQVIPKVQGDNPETTVFEVKPSDDAGMTNLVIPTNRRLYNITLVNSARGPAGDERVYTPILSFTYPDTLEKQVQQRIAERKAKAAEEARRAAAAKAAAARKREETLQRSGVETASGLKEASKLDFAFRITGSAPFRPVRVYSDGKHTYIDLKPSYSGPLPALVPGRSEDNKVLNTRVEAGGTRLVADRVIRDMWLQAGKRRVRITRRGRP